MSAVRVSGKRIARNTLINYVQVVVSALVGLVISRLVLQTLGASDYGLYGVVGGAIAMFTFISGSMSATTTRFVNIEMGKKDGNVNYVFNISNVLHIAVAIVVLLLLESVGIYYILNYLNVAQGKENDALFVFHVSTLITCVGITNVPYRALLVANECFGTIATVEITKTILKLLLVVVLSYYKGNALRMYAIMMCTGTVVSFVAYHVICMRRWPKIVRWNPIKHLKAYKEQFSFSNWSLLGTIAEMLKSHGTHLLINLFFGTIANAAYAVSLTVKKNINVLAHNFSRAAAPQITQLIGLNEIDKATDLAINISRIHLLLSEIVFFPLLVELDFVLHLWLGDNIPSETLDFCKWTLIVALVVSTKSGIGTLIYAFGKLKWFEIQKCFWFLLSFPIGYWLFSIGMPPHSIIILLIIADILNRAGRLTLLHMLFGVDSIAFVRKAWSRPLWVLLIMIGYTMLYGAYWNDGNIAKVIGIFVTALCSVAVAFSVGLTTNEKEKLLSYVKKHLIG